MNDLMTKSFVSYVDLKKEAMKDLEAGPDYGLEMTNASQVEPNLALFLEEAENVKVEMCAIRDILAKLKHAIHNPEALKSLQVNSDILCVLKKARSIRSRIEDMDHANEDNRRLSGYEAGTPVDRLRTSVTNGLRKKLKELMMEFQALRQKLMSEFREMVGRRYFTVTGEYPEEDVLEQIITNGEGGGEDFLQKAIQQHGKGKVLETVVEIKDRHDTVKEMEKSLLELHQVFLDMAVMVEAQGEQINDIEHHVIHAAEYVKDGSKNLKTAKDHQRSSRKCMCIGLVFLLFLILVIVILVATNFSDS